MFPAMQLGACSLICGGLERPKARCSRFPAESIVRFSNIGNGAMNHGQGTIEQSLMKAVNAVIPMNKASCFLKWVALIS